MTSKQHLRSMSQLKESFSSAGSFNSFGSFNSSTSSFSKIGSLLESDQKFKENKTCYICSKKFTLTLRRHHCRDCKESVCDEHSVIRYVREGKGKKLRICDKCDKKHIKLDLQENILNEINEIKEKIELASETNSRLYSEKFERTSRIHNLEATISKAEKEAKRKEEDLESRLKEEIDSNVKAKGRIDDYLRRLEEMKATENEIAEKISQEQRKLIEMKSEMKGLESKKAKLENEESELKTRDSDLVDIETLKQRACQLCKRKLESFNVPRMSVHK